MPATSKFDDLGGHIADVTGPAGPTSFQLLPLTVSDRAANYDRFTYQFTSKKVRVWRMRLTDLPTAEKNTFVTFFHTYAIGSTNSFTYTHTDGTVYTSVRFVNQDLQIERTEPGVFSIEVELEHQIALT